MTFQPLNLEPAAAGGVSLAGLSPHILPTSDLGADIYAFNSRDERSRPFNLLRAQILRQAKAQGWRTIGVTSATPRVGKSFIASNLSASLARIPQLSTYLFDLDLRRSSVAEYFNIHGEVGVTEFLDGRVADLRNLAWQVQDQSLTIFPSFTQKVLSSELLSNSRMDALVAAMRAAQGPTMCILDLPPVFANDDAVIVSQKIDGYILVVEDGVTTAKQVKDALRLLEPATCLGTVLNRYYGGLSGDDYGYGYGGRGAYSDYYN